MQKQRLVALDLFRGLTIMMMIMVNSPNTYGTFSHAYWDGVTFADFVFPFFLVIVGVAVGLGFRPDPRSSAQQRQLIIRVIRRSLTLFALGIFVNLLYLKFADVRVLGVLQRIGIVYGVCALLTMYLSWRALLATAVALLLGYWALIAWVPAPGLVAGQLERGVNLINWFDSAYLPGMLWRGTWDPEGILSTIPAISSGLAGVLLARLIQANSGADLHRLVSRMFVAGVLCLALGWLWSLQFPLIKQIWSSSFVLVTSGMAAIVLASMIWYTDCQGYQFGSRLPLIFGSNAIVAYVFHVALEKLLEVPVAGSSVLGAYQAFALELGLNRFCTVGLWMTVFLLLCFVPVWWLYRRGIFVKI